MDWSGGMTVTMYGANLNTTRTAAIVIGGKSKLILNGTGGKYAAGIGNVGGDSFLPNIRGDITIDCRLTGLTATMGNNVGAPIGRKKNGSEGKKPITARLSGRRVR